MEINNRLDTIIAKFRNGEHVLEYVSGIQPVEYENYASKLEHAFREIWRAKNGLLIRVNYPFVRADQIAIKLMCELYETLDTNRFLCSQLPKSYKTKYVVLYKSITQNISVNEIFRHAERTENEIGAESSLSSTGNMDLGMDFRGLKAELNHASSDAVINSLKKRKVIEDVTEKNQQTTPVPLDPDSSTRALQKLIDDLARVRFILYSEKIAEWLNNASKSLDAKPNLQSLLSWLLKPANWMVRFFRWLMKLSYEILQMLVGIFTSWSQTLGKRYVRILLTLQISEKDFKGTDFESQLNALITNLNVACIVFVY